MAQRIILGAAINLALILAPGLAQAVSPPMSGAPSAPSIWEANQLPPLLARRYNRFEPGSIPERLLEQGQQYLKTPYRRGGSLKTGQSTDCSGFVQFLYQKADIHLPRASAQQAQVGKVAARSLDFSRLSPGDLLFFRQGGRGIGHVGLYLGAGQMLHASSHRRGVTVSDLARPYYLSHFVVARRLFPASRTPRPLPGPPPAGPALN